VIEKLLHSEVSSDNLRSYPRFTQTEIRPLQPDFCYASPSIIDAEFFPRSKAATIPWVLGFCCFCPEAHETRQDQRQQLFLRKQELAAPSILRGLFYS
jgi:hypothetical protein